MPNQSKQQLIDEIEQLKEQLKKSESHDRLTGLYNRNIYFDNVRQKLDDNPNKNYAIICLDVEKFKFINDRYGFIEGDKLLAYIGKKLKEKSINQSIIASRLSSDIYSFLDEEENVNPEALGKEVQEWVKDYPINSDIRIVVGIYHIESKNIPVRLMCDRANLAIETVKNNYLVNFAEYNKNVRDYMFSQHELLNEVERAFNNNEFKVYLQPKFNLQTNKIVGAESLVRWEHPHQGTIYPKDFIPLFEKNMLITRLDEYIWQETCRIIRTWKDAGLAMVPVSVNVSRVDIYSLELSNKFIEFTDKYDIDRRFIQIEITESAFTNDEDQIIKIVDELRSLGFKVLMDDFGSGYSSLNILKDISVDVIKIDTRFLEPGKKENNKGKEILESVIRMAKWIGLQIIAEGVETDEQKKFLIDLGCYYGQGFFYSKAVSEKDFAKLISNSDDVDPDSYEEELKNVINIEELFHADYMTTNLLNSILGGVAIYEFDGKNALYLIKANEFYYDITGNYQTATTKRNRILERIYPEDKEKLLEAFRSVKTAGHRGASVQVRENVRGKLTWLTLRAFFLAEQENKGLYYVSVSDSTEQMTTLNELNEVKTNFEVAFELIELVVLEFDFIHKRIVVQTKPTGNDVYLEGRVLENIPESIIENNIIHPDSVEIFKTYCKHVSESRDVVTCILDLLYKDNQYKRCKITSKSVYEDNKPIKTITVVKYVGEETPR